MFKTLYRLALIGGAIAIGAASSQAQNLDPENTLHLTLKCGKVIIKLRPDVAPKHVAQVKTLTRRGFYDGIIFHRVIEGFMAQGGDPSGNGTGGSGQNIPAEFSSPSEAKHLRGTVSMARARNPDSADSQFFICFEAAPFLDGQYTIWGQVTEGMDYVDKIKRGEPVRDPDKIIRMQVAADAE